MKKRRLFIILSLSFLVVFIFTLSSPLFTLKKVSLVFYDDNNCIVSTKNNKVYNTSEKINKIVSSAEFNYGTSLFTFEKDVYINRIDNKNPYLKLLNAQVVFPNKLKLSVKERVPCCYILSSKALFLLDNDYKILEILPISEALNYKNLVQIKIQNKNGVEISFFNFFYISESAFESGQYLSENNLILTNFKNIFKVIETFNVLKDSISFIAISENLNENMDLLFYTNSNLGIMLKVQNALDNLNSKLSKLFCALETLYYKEKIKTTYGTLTINESLNCSWNNL